MKAILKTEKLCKTFSNDGVQQHVIKNLDLEIMENDFTVIMGASGSGKSTLLYALSGMDKPSVGKVFFDNEDITEYNNDQLAMFRRNHCGFVFQSIYLLENMNVLDNIMTGALVARKNSPELISKAKKLLMDAKNISTLYSLGNLGLSLATLVQLLALAGVITLAQVTFLTDCWIKSMNMILRNILFFLVICVGIGIFAAVFTWFPINNIMAWVAFAMSFTICTVISVFIRKLQENAENKKMEQALAKIKKQEGAENSLGYNRSQAQKSSDYH